MVLSRAEFTSELHLKIFKVDDTVSYHKTQFMVCACTSIDNSKINEINTNLMIDIRNKFIYRLEVLQKILSC